MEKIQMRNRRIERGLDSNRTDRICFDDCIASYFGYINKDYHGIYINAIDFSYVPTNTEKADQLITVDFKKELDKVYGIMYSEVFETNELSSLHIIESIREREPIVIRCDAFGLPWDEYAYRRRSIEGHAYFVIGVDNEQFICNDPYLKKENEKLPFKDFFEGFSCYGKFERNGRIKECDLKAELTNKLKYLVSKDAKERVFDFLNEFNDSIRIDDILPNDNRSYDETFPYKMIEKMRDNRIRFNSIFKYIAMLEKNSIIEKMSVSYDEIIKYWGIMLSVIVKAAATERISYLRKTISNDFCNVVNKEHLLFKQMLMELEKLDG